MQRQSRASRTKPTFAPIDLSQIAIDNPVNQQTATLNLSTFDATQLTLLEVMDICEAVEVEPEALGGLLATKSRKRIQLMYAIAWVIARRPNPDLTLDEVCTWKLDVQGTMNSRTTEASAKRAAMRVNAAVSTGLAPDDAEKLSIADLAAYADTHKRSRRRKAG
jgi:hypothetical protein